MRERIELLTEVVEGESDGVSKGVSQREQEEEEGGVSVKRQIGQRGIM